MKFRYQLNLGALFPLVLLISLAEAKATQNITVTGNFYYYTFDAASGQNPGLQLTRGEIYNLNLVNASFHPFYIRRSSDNALYPNASNQGLTSGTMVLTIPPGEPGPLYYICGNHGALMSGTITLVDPPAPPTVKVLSLSVTTNVVVTSLGTNWTVVPEYNSNLSSSGWASVPGYTNTYSNGTNTTSFDRLEAICGNNVFLRIRQEQPSGQ